MLSLASHRHSTAKAARWSCGDASSVARKRGSPYSSAAGRSDIKLYQSQPGTSDTLIYTADRKFISFAVTAANVTGTAATFTLNVAYQGAAAATTNRVVSGTSVPANATAIMVFPIELEAGDTIRGLNGTSGAITLTIDGERP